VNPSVSVSSDGKIGEAIERLAPRRPFVLCIYKVSRRRSLFKNGNFDRPVMANLHHLMD
jgi:hypothetical protein